jgi:hypothetical protein
LIPSRLKLAALLSLLAALTLIAGGATASPSISRSPA